MTKNYYFLKRLLSLIVISASAFVLYGQTEISNRAGLEAINDGLDGSYILTADIDLTGTNWSPLGSNSTPFTGTLDGNGHIITGLRYDNTDSDNSDYPSGSRKVGLFSVISGGTVKNLGLERAYVKGGKHVGGIAGTLKSGAVVEQCYVGNSYVETGDHGGSIVGNMESGSIVRNCYANGEVFSRNSQGSGLVGMYKDNGTTISKCYYSGIVRSGNPSAIGAWNDGGNPTSEYNVGLAPYVLGSSNLRVTVGNNSTMRGLYALASSILSGGKDDFGAIGTITNIKDSNYGTDKRHGAHIPGGDANALSQEFYEETLGWDFDDVWKMPAHGYPVLQWQTAATTDVSIVAISTTKKTLYPNGRQIDLYQYAFVNNTWKGAASDVIYFTTDSEDVDIVDGKATLSAIGKTKTGTYDVTVNIVAKAGFNLVGSKTTFTIQLKPEFHEIGSIAELAAITDVEAAYKLTADLDFDGIEFTRMNEFKGVLDGNGHIVKNISYDKPTDSDDGKSVGLFKTIRDAHIYNLGLENIHFNGWNDVAGITGQALGKSLIENCYVSNSYFEGRDHVASIAGALKDGSIVRNCYSNARVHSREHQAGGLTGVISFGFIYNSYYAGVISNLNNRAVGIGGYQDNGGQAAANICIENSVSLAPYLLSNNWTADAVRILHDAGDRPYTLVNNYGLATAWRGKNDLSDGKLVSEDTGKIGTDKLQGADVSNEDARTQAFYEETLGWDFDNIWKMSDGGFPVLKWQTAPVVAELVFYMDEYEIEKDNASGLNLSYTVPNTHGVPYAVESGDESKITVDGDFIKVAAAWDDMSAASTTVDLTSAASGISLSSELNFTVIPSAIYSDASLSALSVLDADLIPAFDAHVYNYDVYVDESIKNTVIAATTTQSGAVITDAVNLLGTQELNIGQNVFTLEVNSQNEENSKTYTLTIHRGLFSVSKLDGTGKRQVNVYSSDSNNSKESAYRLLIGKHAVSSKDDKWCPSDGNITTPQATFTFAEIYEVSAVAWRDKHFREGGDGQIDTWKVEVSMDAENWTEVINVSGQADLVNKYETFTPVEARYLRFIPTKNGQGAAWIYGFDIYGAFAEFVDETIISRGKTILAYEGGYWEGAGRESPANILDGHYNTDPWATYTSPQSVDIDLEEQYNINKFKLVAAQENEENSFSAYNVYVKTEAEDDWSDAIVGTISTDAGVQSSTIDLTASPIQDIRFVKLEIPVDAKGKEDGWIRLREFEVYGSKVAVGVNQPESNDSRVYTVNRNIIVSLSDEASGQLAVYNLLGKQLVSQKLDGHITYVQREFEPGVYVVSITNAGKTQTAKVIVK